MFRPLKLWEVLTGLAIVLVVAAILIPGMRACACGSPGTACLSNVKQQVTALLLYSEDWDNRLPHRDLWMDSLLPYTKWKEIITDPQIKAKNQHGYAFDSRLSQKVATQYTDADRRPMVYDSTSLHRNASDPFVSLPHPERHKGKNTIGYLDGHAKRVPLKAK